MKKILFTFLVLISGMSTSAIFQVNLTSQDHVDANPGDGVCEIPSGGFCTLRAAIMEANALPGSDSIVLPSNATIRLTIPGSGENSAATGDLDITDAVAIVASGEDMPTINANELNDRVFHVLSGSGLVSFTNFRVIGGSAGFGDGGGGAINISVNNLVLVTRVWFEGNIADSGGAIFLNPLSKLDIVDSVFRGNAAASQDGGGALVLLSPTQIDKSTIFENLNSDRQPAIFVGGKGLAPNRPGFVSPVVDSAHPTTPGVGGLSLEDIIFYGDFDIAY